MLEEQFKEIIDKVVNFIEEALTEEEIHVFSVICKNITNLYAEKQ